MLTSTWQFCRGGVIFVLVVIIAVQPGLPAQTHVVSPAELRKEAAAATRARKHNVDTVTKSLSSPEAQKALRSAHMDPTRVKASVSLLSDQELAELASRADRAQLDFAAGTLSDRDLLVILVGIAALILIIVAVR
jgi:hypothetical protein